MTLKRKISLEKSAKMRSQNLQITLQNLVIFLMSLIINLINLIINLINRKMMNYLKNLEKTITDFQTMRQKMDTCLPLT